MKLYYSITSPYSRKTRIAIQVKQLDDQIEQIACNPFTDASQLTSWNPLGKVPTLILNDGTAVFDSRVICEYLDGLSQSGRLYPGNPLDRLNNKTTEALVDGILDAAYNIVMERRRPVEESSTTCIQHWQKDIERSLNRLEKSVIASGYDMCQMHISAYCVLAYLDFRLAEIDWRDKYSPGLTHWFEQFENTHPFVLGTKPC